MIFLLPLVAYFLAAAFRQTAKNRLFVQKYAEWLFPDQPQISHYRDSFSFKSFLLQPSFGFRLSLTLLLITVVTVFAIP